MKVTAIDVIIVAATPEAALVTITVAGAGIIMLMTTITTTVTIPSPVLGSETHHQDHSHYIHERIWGHRCNIIPSPMQHHTINKIVLSIVTCYVPQFVQWTLILLEPLGVAVDSTSDSEPTIFPMKLL